MKPGDKVWVSGVSMTVLHHYEAHVGILTSDPKRDELRDVLRACYKDNNGIIQMITFHGKEIQALKRYEQQE